MLDFAVVMLYVVAFALLLAGMLVAPALLAGVGGLIAMYEYRNDF